MYRYWAVFLALAAAVPARADDANPQNVNVTIIAEPAEEKGADTLLPRCDNEEMIEIVLEKIVQYQQEHRPNTIVDIRKQALIAKTLNEFKEIPVGQFDNAQNYRVADALIMAKINRGLNDDEIRLCSGSYDGNVYLVIFRDDDAYRVEIINFVSAGEEKDFAVYYYPPYPAAAAEGEGAASAEGGEAKAESAEPEAAVTNNAETMPVAE